MIRFAPPTSSQRRRRQCCRTRPWRGPGERLLLGFSPFIFAPFSGSVTPVGSDHRTPRYQDASAVHRHQPPPPRGHGAAAPGAVCLAVFHVRWSAHAVYQHAAGKSRVYQRGYLGAAHVFKDDDAVSADAARHRWRSACSGIVEREGPAGLVLISARAWARSFVSAKHRGAGGTFVCGVGRVVVTCEPLLVFEQVVRLFSAGSSCASTGFEAW